MELPIQQWVVAGGAVAVFLLMLGETVFPPIPSEVIMPVAGFEAARGNLTFALVVAAGAAGAMLGNVGWYWLARRWGPVRFKRFATRHGRLTTIDTADVDRAQDWFRRHGAAAVMFGRMVPAIRSIISIPAGLARMQPARFFLFSAAGTLGWTAALAGAGYALGSQFSAVDRYLNPVSTGVIALAAAVYLYRFATYERSRGSGDQP